MSTIYTLWPDGSYSSKAARKINRHHEYSLEFTDSIKNVIEQTLSGNYGVIPIHNTYWGIVHETLEWINRYKDSLLTVMFTKLQIDHCLASANGEIDVRELKTIYSHPQALKQCERYLQSVDAVHIPTKSTTEHIQKLSFWEWVICDEEIARSLGLQILENSICPDDNVTVFWLIADIKNVWNFKETISSINLTKIQS